MWTKKFWLDLLERSIKAAGWSCLAVIGADQTGTISGVDWLGVLNVAGYALVVATVGGLLIGSRVGAENSASWLPEKADPPAPQKRKRSDRGDIGILGLVILVVVVLLLIGLIRGV